MATELANAGCTVCIPNYNGIGMIAACIDSVKRQVCDFPVQIVVHDDASTDNSVAYLRANHPDIELIASDSNVGYCTANNRMAAAARHDYLLLLNNDAELLPGALAAFMEYAREIAVPAVLGMPQYDAESGALLDRGSTLDPFLVSVPNVDVSRRDVAMVAGACLWIPRSLWDDLGGFPPWFSSVAEDLLLCCVARLAGHPVRVLEAPGYRHHVGATQGGGKIRDDRLATTFRRRGLSERNRSCVVAMTWPPLLLLILLPLHLSILLVEGCLLAAIRLDRRYLTRVYLPAIAAPLIRRNDITAWRRRIARLRRTGLREYLSVFTPVPQKLVLLLRHGLPRVD